MHGNERKRKKLMKMLTKIHKAEGKVIISIADKDLIGKEFEEGDKYLNISKSFYQGEELGEEEVLKLLEDANSMNIVGKESVDFCIKNKIVEEEHVLEIEKIPFAIVIFQNE